jgi:phosphoglucomutase
MYKEYGHLESRRLDIVIDPAIELHLEEIEAPETILGMRVIGTKRIDGLKILLEEGSWILLRKSGTENVVRIYAESKERERLQRLIEFGKSLLMKPS